MLFLLEQVVLFLAEFPPPFTHQVENCEPQTPVFIHEIQFNFHNPEVLDQAQHIRGQITGFLNLSSFLDQNSFTGNINLT